MLSQKKSIWKDAMEISIWSLYGQQWSRERGAGPQPLAPSPTATSALLSAAARQVKFNSELI